MGKLIRFAVNHDAPRHTGFLLTMSFLTPTCLGKEGTVVVITTRQ